MSEQATSSDTVYKYIIETPDETIEVVRKSKGLSTYIKAINAAARGDDKVMSILKRDEDLECLVWIAESLKKTRGELRVIDIILVHPGSLENRQKILSRGTSWTSWTAQTRRQENS